MGTEYNSALTAALKTRRLDLDCVNPSDRVTLEQKNEKLKMRKRVETTISDIKKMFPRTIHAITLEGFLIKLTLISKRSDFAVNSKKPN
ncbi:hypothetical protein B0A56_12750 [Flavobacterium columnare NBRC 100251 = ATCC 23463]|nr:hypothetical protein B0A56_12750 [Flavobacterium columnare NBRC 100251 = ATCC 23463]